MVDVGFAVAAVAWVLHVAAMAVAPLSLVQAVIAGGLVLIAFPAQRYFGHRLNRREWLGLGLAAGGLAFLAFTVPRAAQTEGYSIATLAASRRSWSAPVARCSPPASCAAARSATASCSGSPPAFDRRLQRRDQGAHRGDRDRGRERDREPVDGARRDRRIGAFFALARGMQLGEAIPVIATASVSSNCAAILGGVVVFGDPIGSGGLEGLARGLAFAAVIAAAVVMPSPRPAPRRA